MIVSTEAGGRIKFIATDTSEPVYFGVDLPFVFSDHSGWFYNFEHQREQERGLDFTEDLFCIGRFDGVLSPGQKVTFIASMETSARKANAAAPYER